MVCPIPQGDHNKQEIKNLEADNRNGPESAQMFDVGDTIRQRKWTFSVKSRAV